MSDILINTVRLLRAETSKVSNHIPRDGEPLYDRSNKRLRVGNGKTAGGDPVRVHVSHIDGFSAIVFDTDNPEGAIEATPPCIGYDTQGRYWLKSGIGKTGWQLLTTARSNKLGGKF